MINNNETLKIIFSSEANSIDINGTLIISCYVVLSQILKTLNKRRVTVTSSLVVTESMKKIK